MRAAIYFTPPADAPLTRAAALWLGRDAFTGAATRPADAAIDPVVAEAARYGFHATMRAPFSLSGGTALEDVERSLRSFAAARRPFALSGVELGRLGRFFALVPAKAATELQALEADVLEAFEPLRAPLNEAEHARRRPETLNERQRRNLDRWGYPHVLEDFRFHMTLTGPVADEAVDEVEALLRARFEPFIGAPLAIDRLALFVEDAPGTPFKVRASVPFGPDAPPPRRAP